MSDNRMSRRSFMSRCAAGAAAVLTANMTAALAGRSKRPNVVLFVSDDHGREALGCYGNPVVKTPNLDALAADGVKFSNAFCTSASCSASRSVILTGMYNHANGQYGHQHAYHHFISFDDVKSLPVQLTEAGYRTCRIGKYHVAPEEVYKFDIAIPANSRSPVEMANKCRDFIAAEDKPFFLYFCTSDPHRSGGVDESSPYKPNLFGNKSGGYPGVKEVTFDPAEVIVPPFLPDSPQCRAELAQYYQSVNRVDQGIGRLVEVIKQAGKWDDTVFIYISDNGVAFAGAKTTLYEPGMRLPCIVRRPDQKNRGITCDALVNYADLAPTILEMAGARAVPATQGRSFVSALESEHPKGFDTTYASHTFHEITMYYPMRVVRERRFKLIWNIAYGLEYPFASDLYESPTWQEVIKSGKKRYGKRAVEAYLHRAKFELYDLENDPDEVVNLADDPRHADTLDRLKKKLKDFQKKTKDPWILKWNYE